MSRSSRVAFPLTSLLLVVAGTGCEAVYDYSRAQHGGHGPGDAPPPAECHADADCRAFSNYCDGCACDALAVGEKDPVCNGMAVQCFADPCLNKTAACSAGQCVLASPTPPKCDQRTQGGPTSCKPADLWKQYASDDCKASGLVLSEISPREDCGGGFTRFVDYTCCTP